MVGMVINIDTLEKFEALSEALDQYTMNNECSAEGETQEEIYAEFPSQKAAEEMRDELAMVLVKIAETPE